MKVKIFTEGGNNIGLGHISRCSSLYNEILSRKIDTDFVIYGDVSDYTLLNDKKFININWLNENYLLNNVSVEDYCIVDSYLAGKELLNIISNNSKKALFIDDVNRIPYPKGIVLNPSLGIGNMKYAIDEGTKILFGLDYIIIRTPFIGVIREGFNENPKNVLITMGGADISNLTPVIIKEICRYYKEFQFNIIIGDAFMNLEEIHEALKYVGNNVKLYYNVDAKQMMELMLESDFAITAAGQTIYELLATQTPFIPIKVVDNQNNNVNSLINLELVSEVIDYQDKLMTKKLLNYFKNFIDSKVRRNITDKYKKIEISQGPKKIIDELLKVT